MPTTKLKIKTNSKNYLIIVGNNIIKNTGGILKKKFKNLNKIVIITDKNIPPKILVELKKSLKKFKLITIKLSSGEKIKNINVALKLTNKILRENLTRSDCIVSLGGGVIGDLAGFISSIVKRGTRFVNIPTTLLAQVDASIGGKTAVNSVYGKNLIGSFYQPDLVISDTSVLQTLPKREIICGYAEILKHAIILDKKFFYWLFVNGKKILISFNRKILNEAIIKSCKIKAAIVASDEKEKRLRAILNFGHTFGHAFERVNNYSKKLSHGEGVLLGMILASKISFEKKFLKIEDLKIIEKHYENLNLIKNVKKYINKKQINLVIKFMKTDKKNIDKNINLILISEIGKAFISNKIPENYIKKFIYQNLK